MSQRAFLVAPGSELELGGHHTYFSPHTRMIFGGQPRPPERGGKGGRGVRITALFPALLDHHVGDDAHSRLGTKHIFCEVIRLGHAGLVGPAALIHVVERFAHQCPVEGCLIHRSGAASTVVHVIQGLGDELGVEHLLIKANARSAAPA